jgi:oligopeptide/dipeptide ABC transporter ATP-binding protein
MYLGRIVETGPTTEVLSNPIHPYTRALVSVVPVPHPDPLRRRIILSGETPDPSQIPPGCRFAPRCPQAEPVCRMHDPQLEPAGATRSVACILAET